MTNRRRCRGGAGVVLVVALLTSLTMVGPAASTEAPLDLDAPPLMAIDVALSVDFGDIAVPDGHVLLEVLPAPDHAHWLASVEVDGTPHVAVLDEDLTGYRCVTCGVVGGASKPSAFPDGERVLVVLKEAVGGPAAGDAGLPFTGGTGDIQYAVLECAPSLYACDTATSRELTFPIDGLTSVPQGAQNREAELHPSGEFIKWTEVRSLEGPRMTLGRLVRTDAGYEVQEPRVIGPAYDLSTGALEDHVHAGRFYEAGHAWADGGRTLEVRFTSTAINYDIHELDLATGRVRQVTTDLDWNEQTTFGPGDLVIAASARGLDRMDVFSQLVRPSLIDALVFGQVGRVGLWNNRRCMNEKWLLDRATGQQLGGYGGQPLVTEDGWAIRGVEFLPDGTGAVLNEHLIPSITEPADEARRHRLRVVRFPTVAPADPEPVVDLDDLDLDAWTQPYDSYVGGALRDEVSTVIAGPAGGTATLDTPGTFAGGRWQVTYDGWSEDGRSFLDGTESITVVSPVVEATWEADLQLSGAHTGSTVGTLHVLPQNRYQGQVRTELDGRVWEGPTTEADCPGILQPALAVEVVAGDAASRTVRVTAQVAEDAFRRPVHGASVEVGGRRVTTDEAGLATVPADGPLVVTAGGFVPYADAGPAQEADAVDGVVAAGGGVLAATGGGAALLGLAALGAASVLRGGRRGRRRETGR